MSDCRAYWSLADYLPLSIVAQYWCEQMGVTDMRCQDAMRAAVTSACEKRRVRYRRNDGKTFNDPPTDLADRGLLEIERVSFDAWVMENFTASSPLPTPPSDNKLLQTIAAMLAAWPGGIRAHPSGKELEWAAQAVGVSISDDSILKAFKAAWVIAPTLKPPA
jgi:hypothetical protein